MGPSVNECDANPGSPFRSYWQANFSPAVSGCARTLRRMVDPEVHERTTARRAERGAPKLLGCCGSRSFWSGRCQSSGRPG
jgi:hypothetical protein